MQKQDRGSGPGFEENQSKENKSLRILIAIPTFESIFPDTYKSVWDLECGEHTADFDFVRGYDCATARNRIVQKAIDGDYDYVLMVDNDVVVPKDILLNMLDEPVDVCLGYYAHRDGDNMYRGRVSVCRYANQNGFNFPYFNYPLESEYTGAELKDLRDKGEKKIRIHGGGMGCALIRTELLRRMEYPWYDWVNYKDDNRGMLSEDLYFCEQCKQMQVPVYTDVRAGCGHILRHVQWPE